MKNKNYTLKINQPIDLFLKESAAHLALNEVINSQLVSFAERFQTQKKEPYRLLQLFNEAAQVTVAAIQTDPERNLIVSQSSTEEINIFVEEIIKNNIELNGLIGPNHSVDPFAMEWKLKKGCDFKTDVNLRLFELTKLIPPAGASGHARVATEKDLDLVVDWVIEFGNEALPNDPHSSREVYLERVLPLIQNGSYFLWEDQSQVVSLVGSTRESAAGRWIAPVYTPKECRGKGYGTALTAYASESILKSHKRALLYTDLSNPTSNSIYQKIGYRPLGDFKTIVFLK